MYEENFNKRKIFSGNKNIQHRIQKDKVLTKQRNILCWKKSYDSPRGYYIHPTWWIKQRNIKMYEAKSMSNKND